MDWREQLAPEFQIRISGTMVDENKLRDVVKLSIEQDVATPGMFAIRVVNWDMDALKMTWSDDDSVKLGSQVEVQMGYMDALENVIAGDVTALEPEFVNGEIPMLTVRGYDRKYRLLRGTKTRSFRKAKDSDIAAEVAQGAGLGSDTVDTGVTHEYVLQHNQTDFAFLEERARRIGYEAVVEDRTLYYRPKQHARKPAFTMSPLDSLIEFRPRLTGLGQAGGMTLRGWDPNEKSAILAKAAAGDETGNMGNTGGPFAGTDLGDSGVSYVATPVRTQAEADQSVQARFDDMSLQYVTGEGISIGRTDLRAGAVVQLEGLGTTFSGPYYVTSTAHTWTPGRGYRTSFRVRRNAS